MLILTIGDWKALVTCNESIIFQDLITTYPNLFSQGQTSCRHDVFNSVISIGNIACNGRNINNTAASEIGFSIQVSKLKRPDYYYCHLGNFQIDFLITCYRYANQWHVDKGGFFVHSSSTSANGESGYLFLGESHSGKSTIAKISNKSHYHVLGDDLNFLLPNSKEDFKVIFCPSFKYRDFAYSKIHPKLRAIFQLKKDNSDFLVPMNGLEATRSLYNGFLQSPKSVLLEDNYQIKAFANCAGVAKKAPCYELHFTKSAKFLDVIKSEFPDSID